MAKSRGIGGWLCREGWVAKSKRMGGYAETDGWLSREGWPAMPKVMGG